MGLQLAEGLSFCIEAGQFVFLDLKKDRYFCLTDSLAESFAAVLTQQRRSADCIRARERMVAAGIVSDIQADSTPQPCTVSLPPRHSLLDEPLPRAPNGKSIKAFVEIQRTKFLLRRHGLCALVNRISSAKSAMNTNIDVGDTDVAAIAAAHETVGLVIGTHNRCLLRSAALIRQLIAAGIAPNLIMAVKLRPFAAHCWVQLDDRVLNDRAGNVRQFTPILIV